PQLPLLLHAAQHPDYYTLSLHDALPISFSSHDGTGRTRKARSWLAKVSRAYSSPRPAHLYGQARLSKSQVLAGPTGGPSVTGNEDRKSTRLNSSHQINSYAGVCLKKTTY